MEEVITELLMGLKNAPRKQCSHIQGTNPGLFEDVIRQVESQFRPSQTLSLRDEIGPHGATEEPTLPIGRWLRRYEAARKDDAAACAKLGAHARPRFGLELFLARYIVARRLAR